jgi:tRNA A-37 threonylcarbamoyl transferase component Bud32
VGRGAIALGAVLIVGGGAALGYAVTRKVPGMPPEANAAMGSAVAELEAALKQTHSNARVRATTISENLYVRRAIEAGDEATAQNMVDGGELRFDPKDGEVIEIGKVEQGVPIVLVRQPAAGAVSRHGGKSGSYAELVGDRAVVYEVAEIKVADKAGFVTVTQPRSLAASYQRLADAKFSGRLELGGKSRDFGNPVPPDATLDPKPLSEPGARLVVVAPTAPVQAMPVPILVAGAGAAGLGFLVILVGMIAGRKRGEPLPPAIQSMPTMPTIPPANQLSNRQGVAAGTPSPVDVAYASSPINPNNVTAGTLFGRWEVIKRLGSGGMADVYLAQSKGEAGFEKLVAIKVMHAHLARNERAVEHFLDEARLAARIHHPNVVAIQDLGKIGNDYVIVMEYVDGVDLERLLISSRAANRPIPLDVGLGILCRMCDGLNAAHTATGPDGTPLGIVHRDVKSANILISRQGGVKVVDFGIAKAATQAHLSVAGETKGTPSMMAPEQRVGEQVDVRADVYAVSAVGFEILTGHGVNLDLAALAHLGIENWPHLPLPSSLRPNLPTELDEILLAAMSFDRESRPADCVALEAQLEAVMKKHGLGATDKDLARWVDSELRLLVPPFDGGTSLIGNKPIGLT